MSDQSPEANSTTLFPPLANIERLAVLGQYQIFGTASEDTFDEIVQLAAQICQTPVALITLVDEERQWVKAKYQFGATVAPLETGFCPFVVQQEAMLVIPDTLANAQFAANPAVTTHPGVRFYAGVPLVTNQGYVLGSLCVIDYVPHQLTAHQVDTLQVLSRQVMAQLELRLASRQLVETDRALLEVTQSISTSVGSAFFHSLVQHLAKALGVDYAHISQIVENEPDTVRTIARWGQGQIMDNVNYSLRTTPCGHVVEHRKICCYPHQVQAYFPDAELLQAQQVESYAAIPFSDSTGKILGVLALMSTKPLVRVKLVESLLTIFAIRIATELERQQTEKMLRESEEFNRSIFESSADCINVLDLDGCLLSINCPGRCLMEIEDCTPFLGKHWVECWQEPYRQVAHNAIKTALAGGIGRFSGYCPTVKGMPKWWDVVISPVFDIQGNPKRLVAISREITERKQAELALQESEERLRLALEAAGMITWDWDLLTNKITCSDNYERLFGRVPDRFVKSYQAFLSCIHPEDIQSVTEVIIRSLKDKVCCDHEFRVVRSDGSISWLVGKGQVFEDDAGKAIRMIGIAMDVTGRKQAAEQIKVSLQEKAELLRVSQLKDDFLSTVSHELRTPMANMKMAIALLKTSPTVERSQRYLEILHNECTREIELINDLLDLQRLESASYPSLLIEAINLPELLSTLIEPFQDRAKQQQQNLRLSLPPDIPALICDRNTLERILAELLNNACKYTPGSGEIVLSSCYKTLEAVTVFTVSNSLEIAAAELPRIFEKFYRVPHADPWKRGGTGLGLALVKKLVEQIGGIVFVQSSNGWTTFTIKLPNQLKT